jgi:hypothetical protein
MDLRIRHHTRITLSFGIAAATIVYFAVDACLIVLCQDVMNPDAVAYLRIAHYYASGQFDLAVNSWWGPLLSWCLVPFVWLGCELMLPARIIQLLAGWGFALGVMVLTSYACRGRSRLLGLAIGLLLAIDLLPEFITPDMLLGCFIIWYLVLAYQGLGVISSRSAFLMGALGGVAFLTKHYVLPFVLCHLLLTAALNILLFKIPARLVAKQFFSAFGGLAILATPWIVVMSFHEGSVTFSTAGRGAIHMAIQSRARSPEERVRYHSVTYLSVRAPREGRIATNENPSEKSLTLKARGGLIHATGSLFSQVGFSAPILVCMDHTVEALTDIKKLDLFGLAVSACLGALLYTASMVRRGPRNQKPDAFVIWSVLTAGLYIGGYVPANIERRLLWPAYGVLVVLSIYIWMYTIPALTKVNSTSTLRVLTWTILLVAFGYNAVVTVGQWGKAGGEGARSSARRSVAAKAPLSDRFASNDYCFGLAAAYWKDVPFLGEVCSKSPNAMAEELAPVGQCDVLIVGDILLVDELSKDPRFVLLGTIDSDFREMRSAVFRFTSG